MNECSLLGEVYDRTETTKKTRLSKQCKQCIHLNREKSCYYNGIKVGAKQYRVTHPFGKCDLFKEGEGIK